MTENVSTVSRNVGGFSSAIFWFMAAAVVFFLLKYLSSRKKKAVPEISPSEEALLALAVSPAVPEDGALTAAIAAAISFVLKEEGITTGFVVRRIRRSGPALR